jgi:stage V sporulation protein R
MRNPYHLGYHLWNHIEELYRDGKVDLEFIEETDQEKKELWKKPGKEEPLAAMEHLVRTITDYEFLRRFLTSELVETFHLNRIPKFYVNRIGLNKDTIIRDNEHFVWIDPDLVKGEMLSFFTHFQRPRIYLIDTDFIDGGLLLYHRDDGQKLRKDWIRPTLKNINFIWKGAASLAAGGVLYTYSNNRLAEKTLPETTFEQVLERMKKSEKPIKA